MPSPNQLPPDITSRRPAPSRHTRTAWSSRRRLARPSAATSSGPDALPARPPASTTATAGGMRTQAGGEASASSSRPSRPLAASGVIAATDNAANATQATRTARPRLHRIDRQPTSIAAISQVNGERTSSVTATTWPHRVRRSRRDRVPALAQLDLQQPRLVLEEAMAQEAVVEPARSADDGHAVEEQHGRVRAHQRLVGDAHVEVAPQQRDGRTVERVFGGRAP